MLISKKTVISIVLLIAFIFIGNSYPLQDKKEKSRSEVIPRHLILPCIDLIINSDYTGAEDYINELKETDDLLNNYLHASVLYSYIIELESSLEFDKFMDFTEEIINETKKRLEENEDDITARFFLGIAHSFRAGVNNVRGKSWAAYRNGKSAVKELKKCVEQYPDFVEPHLVIGSYKYWLSAKNIFRFLFFVPDNRNEGIAEIEDNIRESSISYAMSINQLIWILLDKKDFENAEKYAKLGLEIYPESRLFQYPAAESAFRLSNYEKAVELYGKVRESLKSDGLSGRYFWAKITYKQADTLFESG
ncbi:hypothetical protein ACFL7D_10450, partial [candidate division KSB1 bacterium]